MKRLSVALLAMAVAIASLSLAPGVSAAQPDITAGLAYDAGGTDAPIWTPSKVFFYDGFAGTASEVTAVRASISSFQGIVYPQTTDNHVTSSEDQIVPDIVCGLIDEGTYSLIWIPSRLFSWSFVGGAAEITSGGSITCYNPADVTNVQVVIHQQYEYASGAGAVGRPASTSVVYVGSSTAATIVPSSSVPSSHSTVLGAAPYANSALILGPNPVSGVVTGNSVKLFAFARHPVGGIAELPDTASTPAEKAGAPAEGSGWSAPAYAVLGGGLAAAVVALTAGAWYARRRWVR